MEEDAQSAAELTVRSNKYSSENNMSGAGAAYTEAQEIMNKYKKDGKFEDFYQLYINYLQDESASTLGSQEPVESNIEAPDNKPVK